MSDEAPRRLIIDESSESSVNSFGSIADEDDDATAVQTSDHHGGSPTKSDVPASVDAIIESMINVDIHKTNKKNHEEQDEEEGEDDLGYEGDSDALLDTDAESTADPKSNDLFDSDSDSDSESQPKSRLSNQRRRIRKITRKKYGDTAPGPPKSRGPVRKKVDNDDDDVKEDDPKDKDACSIGSRSISSDDEEVNETLYDSESNVSEDSADDLEYDDYEPKGRSKTKAKGRSSRKTSEQIEFSDESSGEDDDDDSVANEELCGKTWTYKKQTKEYFLKSVESITMPTYCVPASLYKKLYDHQRIGVAWMASLYKRGIGGLLGDDMGMGKTFTTLAYIAGLMRAKTISSALVVAPVSVLRSWEKEAEKIIKTSVRSVSIHVINSTGTKKARERKLKEALESPASRPTLIITTYGLVTSSADLFIHEDKTWGVCVCDEAQTIKNHNTQISKKIREICHSPETRRLLLTGTPIMNRLNELWALFDFCCSGRLLGPLTKFKSNFARPIEAARDRKATKYEISIGEKANKALQRKLRPFFLQRMKADILAHMLPPKHDLVVWTHISEKQREMYTEYVNAKDSIVASVLAGEVKSPLAAITWLKKLCGHPILCKNPDHDIEPNQVVPGDNENCAELGHDSEPSFSLDDYSPEELINQAAKLQVLTTLIDKLTNQGHKCLVFSQSTKMLDVIEKVLGTFHLSRIDGSTKEKDRQLRVDNFNTPNSGIDVMLLSTKAAGVGLTLTGASRAIIYDPSWTPAEDAQAIDRCYRIGQKKEVMVFRLIAAGTIEEKMYERQVHKDGISRTVLTKQGSATARYYDQQELRQLFKLAVPGYCAALERLKEDGQGAPALANSSGFLSTHDGVVGISAHDGLYNKADLAALLNEDGNIQAPLPKENPFGSHELFGDDMALQLLEENEESAPIHVSAPVNTSAISSAPVQVIGKSQRALQNIGNQSALAHGGVPSYQPYNPTKPGYAPHAVRPFPSMQGDSNVYELRDNEMVLTSANNGPRHNGAGHPGAEGRPLY